MTRVLLVAALFCCVASIGCASTPKASEHPTSDAKVAHCGCGESCNCKYEETKGAEPCTCPAPAAPAPDAAAPTPAP